MDDLTQVYRNALVGRIEALEAARDTRPERAAESIATIRLVAHSLRGSGGTFGFPEISRAAALLEDASEAALDAALHDLLVVLRSIALGSTNTGRVLIVHGDPARAARLKELADPLAGEVTVAETRAKARELLGARTFDLVAISLALPDADGRSLLLDLRGKAETADVPTVVVAMGADAHQKAECFRMGADAFFDEPVDGELFTAVASARLRRSTDSPGRAALSAPLKHTEPAPAARGRHVLVVEDDEMVASILKHRLDREGFEVLHFTDGVQALAAIEGKPLALALAILDVKVPGMDGFELLTRLRGLPDVARFPVMMLTALGAEQDVVRGLGLGADDYMVKPFSPAEVMARVHRLLQRK